MTPFAYWVHDLSPFVIQFTDTIGIRYYGLAYVLAFVGAVQLLKLYARKGRSPLPEAQVWDLMFALVLGVMIGGRLGSFLLYTPEELFRNPLQFFKVWDGGMASHGGFIGVTIALWWYSRRQKLPLLRLSDVVVSTVPLGLLLGRVANFINGELPGRPTDVKWAVIFPHSPPPLVPRHPSQLYQAALEGFLLLLWMQVRFWRSDVASKYPGALTGEFLFGYAILRSVGEHFREPDAELILGLTRGTFYSIFVAICGIGMIAYCRSRQSTQSRS